MNMMARVAGPGAFRHESEIARELGSPFVAAVLEAGGRQLHRAPRTAELIASWPNDPAAAALAMRFNSAVHALARRGTPPALAALYRGQHGDFDTALASALAAEDQFIAEWMLRPTQTNEVARAAPIVAALMTLRRETGLPAALLEIGSSCGLNLNLARYAYDLGGVAAGDPESPVRIAPAWRGRAPEAAPVEVVAARGADLRPLDPRDEATRERLLSYVWADQPRRAGRLEQAIEIARRNPPRVEQANAATWLPERLAEAPVPGVCRVVCHSMVLQYLGAEDRATIVAAVRRAGARATSGSPLAWINFEWTESRSEVRLSLTSWPHGETRVLAVCHPYGDWVDWRG